MRQDRDKPVRHFGARLRGQVLDIFRFVITCPSCKYNVNYTDAIVRDVLSRGIADPDIQLDLLGDKNQDMSLEKIFQFIEAKEAGKRSASRLLNTFSVEAARSSYQRTKHPLDEDKQGPCSYCGKRGHSMKSATRIRRNQCTAFGHKCERCHRDNHFENMCHSKDTPHDRRPSQTERFNKGNAVFNSLCNAKDGSSDDKVCNINSNHRGRQQVSIPLNHHVYDSLSNTWIKRNSKPQPFINLTVEALPGDHKTLGIELLARVLQPLVCRSWPTPVAKSCLAGLKVIHRLGLRESDLIPVTMHMHTATNSSIRILGAILLRLSSRDPRGQLIETRRMTYITLSSDKLFLSREACIDLGIITNDFPTLHATYNYSAARIDGRDKSSCGCLVRRLSPPAPTTLPFAATDENREKLQQFLLDFYGASTFNTCEPVKLILTDDLASIASNHDAFRHPTQSLPDLRVYDNTDSDIEECVIAAATTSLNALNLKSDTWDRVRTATASDEDMLVLTELIESGMPEFRHEMPNSIREYFQFRDDLSTIDGVIVYKDRIVIPPSLRDEVLCALHSAHQGVTSMIARAESSVFWPAITPAIAALRASCLQCNRNAPSNSSAPPVPPTNPEYPFQCLCADFSTYKGNHYLDRYSNWSIVERSSDGALGLIYCFSRTFVTYGIPVELASDGGPEFTATITRQFLADWGVHHRLSSVAFPHSNCRAKLGVKTVKRLLMDNTGPSGTIDTDSFQRAMLQYRNTPDRNTKLSPAMCIFGRPIRDFIPIIPGNYRPHETWRSTWKTREEALRNRHMRCAERLSEHTKWLPPLVVGDHVRIQNQFNQYVISVDGSRRVTLRNRKFLRKYVPVQLPPSKLTIDNDIRIRNAAPTLTPTIVSNDVTTTSPQLTEPKNPIASDPPAQPVISPKVSQTPRNAPTVLETAPPDREKPTFDGDLSFDTTVSPSRASMSNPSSLETTPSSPRMLNTPRRSGRAKHAPKWFKDYIMTVQTSPDF
ncbi:unnamed protein product [Acanthosepion pharaonis]|uniref:Integrase catalytic domain-containing protein n=1 Tax=Acanthosepion pharaonis TaxID=158019 RepID=A0A812DPJ1_ACAPH|nr:unnamed protein product [Sepia pharaonis]